MAQYDTSYSRTRQEATSNFSNVIKNSKLIVTNPIQINLLNTVQKDLDEDETVRRYTFGRKDPQKRNRTILIVGETGTGKSSLINMMVNYMLGVKWEDKIRFQIIPVGVDQTKSQTTAITVYEIYGLEELSVPFSLTVIDTPGYEDTIGRYKDKNIAQNLYTLLKSVSGVQHIDAVCLMVKATENTLSDTKKYIFDAILSIFGKNIEKNLLTLITFSHWTPPPALNAVMNSGIPFRRDEGGQPVHFLFDNLPPEKFATKYKETYKTAWDNGEKSLREFFQILDQMETQNLRMTEYVLGDRRKLEACIQSLDNQIEVRHMKQKELEGHQKTLEKHKEDMRKNNNFTYKYNVVVMKKVKVKSKATCCTVCEVNCHYPGCWWATNLRWCSVMENRKCTVCPGKCSYEVHKKGNEIYEAVKEEKTGTYEDLKKDTEGKILSAEEVMSTIQKEVMDSEAEMSKLIERSYKSILRLRELALKFKSDSTLKCIRRLIEILKENKDMEKAETLQKMLDM
ncbi:uncharacterized protein LOC118234295 [Anguilla anguilla]|uniref:uncharacterized protein LOC118234295 n=1 Tax=Anguilla anguilla TaxID=7936 RepID=UPI0015A944DA|nr:uncharacterized protein LOC118234295 [Anguilla anguilla]XP_035286625.1 uncharacterized protein LOC118234295 [Anguilla anguilla]